MESSRSEASASWGSRSALKAEEPPNLAPRPLFRQGLETVARQVQPSGMAHVNGLAVPVHVVQIGPNETAGLLMA